MQTIQIRLPTVMVKQLDRGVKKGIYASRSDAVRDSLRRASWKDWEASIGTMNLRDNRDSVEIIRQTRKKLSSQAIDLNEINSL